MRSRDQEAAATFAETMSGALQQALSNLPTQEMRLLGPAEAPVFRLKGYYRYHFQLQSPRPGTLHQVLRSVLPTLRPSSGVEFSLDIDPFQML